MTCVSIITPVLYAGDYRPYFTVQNSDYKEFCSFGDTQGFQSSCIVGITNPFFIKSFDKWPHLCSISFNSGNVKTKKITKRKDLLGDYGEAFFSANYEFVIEYKVSASKLSKNFIKRKTKDDDLSLITHINNDVIRRYFEDLTESFLEPLKKCFESLLKGMKNFVLRSEHQKVFKQEKFYHYLVKNGYQQDIFSAQKDQVLDFYKKFIYSINFKMWLQQRIMEIYYNLVLNIEENKKLLLELGDMGKIDLFFRLLAEYQLEVDPQVRKMFKELLNEILDQLPKEMTNGLVKTMQESIPLYSETDFENAGGTSGGEGNVIHNGDGSKLHVAVRSPRTKTDAISSTSANSTHSTSYDSSGGYILNSSSSTFKRK